MGDDMPAVMDEQDERAAAAAEGAGERPALEGDDDDDLQGAIDALEGRDAGEGDDEVPKVVDDDDENPDTIPAPARDKVPTAGTEADPRSLKTTPAPGAGDDDEDDDPVAAALKLVGAGDASATWGDPPTGASTQAPQGAAPKPTSETPSPAGDAPAPAGTSGVLFSDEEIKEHSAEFGEKLTKPLREANTRFKAVTDQVSLVVDAAVEIVRERELELHGQAAGFFRTAMKPVDQGGFGLSDVFGKSADVKKVTPDQAKAQTKLVQEAVKIRNAVMSGANARYITLSDAMRAALLAPKSPHHKRASEAVAAQKGDAAPAPRPGATGKPRSIVPARGQPAPRRRSSGETEDADVDAAAAALDKKFPDARR